MIFSKFSLKIIGDTEIIHYSKYDVLVTCQCGMELFHIIGLFQLGVQSHIVSIPLHFCDGYGSEDTVDV